MVDMGQYGGYGAIWLIWGNMVDMGQYGACLACGGAYCEYGVNGGCGVYGECGAIR